MRSIRHGSLPVSHAGLLSKRAVVLQAADITDRVWTCMRQKATGLPKIIEDTCFTSIDSARRKTYPILFFWRLASLLGGVFLQLRPYHLWGRHLPSLPDDGHCCVSASPLAQTLALPFADPSRSTLEIFLRHLHFPLYFKA